MGEVALASPPAAPLLAPVVDARVVECVERRVVDIAGERVEGLAAAALSLDELGAADQAERDGGVPRCLRRRLLVGVAVPAVGAALRDVDPEVEAEPLAK